MKALEPKRDEWEKQLLAGYEAGELEWKFQHPTSAKSANGAVLTIHNDDLVDMTSYSGANLTAFKAPGNGLVVVSGPNPDNETYMLTMQPGTGTWRQLGLELVQDESLPGIRLARGADRLVRDLSASLAARISLFRGGAAPCAVSKLTLARDQRQSVSRWQWAPPK